jgi:hypothetical protein
MDMRQPVPFVSETSGLEGLVLQMLHSDLEVETKWKFAKL